MPSLISTPEAIKKAQSLDADNMTNNVEATDDEVKQAGFLSVLTGWNEDDNLQNRNYLKEKIKNSDLGKYFSDFVPAVKDAWERGKITAQQAEIMVEYRRTFRPDLLDAYEVEETRKSLIPRDDKAEGMLRKFATFGAENIPLAIDMMEGGLYRGGAGLVAGVGAGALTGPAAPVMMPALGMSGFIAAGTGGMAERSAQLVGGLYLKELLDNGHTLENAVMVSDVVGVFEGLVEVAGMRLPSAFKHIPGVRNLIKKSAGVAFTSANPAINSIVRGFAEGTKDVAKEYAEEIVQSIAEISGKKFLDTWDGPAYQEYVETQKANNKDFIDPNAWSSLGRELLVNAEESFYGVVGMITPGVVVQTAAYGAGGVAEGVMKRPPVPEFKTSDEVDEWTMSGQASEADLPALVEARDKNYAISKKFMAERDTENALRYGQQGAFYREAIENITGLHGERFKPSKISRATTYAKKMVSGIKDRLDQSGSITVEWPGYNKEQAVEMRRKLLVRRKSILKNAGSIDNVGQYLRDKKVPGPIADSIKTYLKSEQDKPFTYSVNKSTTHALKYKGLDDGSEWYRRIGFEEIIENETSEEAAKFFAIVGETSRQSDPLTNLAKALNIWADYKAGEPMEEIAKRGGLVPEDEMMSLLKDGKKAIRWTEDLVGQEEGQIKLRDFVDTLQLAFKDPSMLDTYTESVLDFRMGQYFYNEDPVPVGVRRERAKSRMLEIRDNLRKTDDPTFWTTDRVQAALWHWVKDDRVKKGLDPDRPHWTFDNAKKRLVGDYYGLDMREVTDEYVRGYVKSILTDGEMLIYDHYSKNSNIKVLDPKNQGTGKPGKEWSKQAVPGEDRPKVIHLYQGKTQAERQFVNDNRYRAIFRSGKIYNFDEDPLKLRKKYAHLVAKSDAIELGKRDKEMIDGGYLGFKNGHVTVVFNPVRAMQMRGFYLAVGGTFSQEQLEDAKANAPEFTRDSMEEIDALEKSGNEGEVADKIREHLLIDLESPIIDTLQANTADGFWESEAERSIVVMSEAADKIVLRGKLSKFLNRFWQYVGVMSEYAGEYKPTGKKPQGIQEGQAPSVVMQFTEELPYDTLQKFNENLDAFGIKGSTYDKRNHTIIVHHIKERDFKTGVKAFPAKKNRFAGIVENAINWSGLPEHTISQHWFDHTVIERGDYEQNQRIGKDREQELGVDKVEADFFIDPEELPEHLQRRGSVDKLAIIETEIETGKPEEVRGNLLDPELMDLTPTDKVRSISEDFKAYYFERWDKDGQAVVNTKWQLEGESLKKDPGDLTTFSKNLYNFQGIKNAAKKVLTSERGSIELRKPTGVYEQLKDSKLVDEDGNLVPAFHGTSGKLFDIASMKPSKGGLVGPGIYFTPDPRYAAVYTGVKASRMIPAYLDIKKPYKTKDKHGEWIEGSNLEGADFIQDLKNKGYDGVFLYEPTQHFFLEDIRDPDFGKLTEITVFSQDQIFPIFEEGVKPTISKMILDERGSVELRKKYFKAVAMKDSVTGRVLEGDENDIHATLYNKLPETFQSRMLYDDMGFVDWDGEFYTRKEAAEVMGIEQAESRDMRKRGFLEDVIDKGMRRKIVEFGERHGILEKADKPIVKGEPETGAVEYDPSVFKGHGKKAEPWPTRLRTSGAESVIALTDIVNTKSRIRAITGQVKLGTLVTTDAAALKISLTRQAQAARAAFIAGKREGIDITTVKLEDLKGKQRERVAKLQEQFQEYKDHVKQIKETARTRKEVTKIIDGLKKISKNLKTIPDPEKSTLEDFFKEFDMTKLTGKNKLRLQKTRAWLTENEDSVELPERMWTQLDRLEKTAIRDLTVDEIRDVSNMVKHVYTLAKTKQKIWVNRKQRDFTEALKASVKEMKPKLVAAGEALSSLPSRFDKLSKGWEKVQNAFGLYQEHYDLVTESLAGPDSVLHDVLYKTVKRGIIKQLDYRQKVVAELERTTGRNFMQENGISDIKKWLKEPVSLGKHTITRDQRMSLYKHFMNDDNRNAILAGGIGLKDSLDPNAVIEITEDEVLLTLAGMTKAELVFAGQGVSDLFSKQGAELARVFRERNGYELELVRNYYPKDTMPLGFSSHDFQSKKTLDELTRKVNRIGIEKGMLHHRMGAALPIYLNGMTEDINNSIHNAAAYIGLEMPLTQASRLLEALKQELPQRYGRETYRVIDQGLRDIAGEWKTFTEVEKVLMKMKDKATTAILGLNPWVMMKQVMSLPMYWRYVDMEYVVKGALKSIWSPKEISARHKLFSPEYMERVKVGYSRDVADVFKPGKRFLSQQKSLKEHLLGGIQFFDKMAVIPGMQGAVDMVLDQMKDGKMSDQVKMALDITDADVPKLSVGEKLRLAYQYADFATQRTQPMFSPEHRSSLSRGGSIEKIMTMFGSATNQFLNMIIRDYRSAVVRKDPQASSKLAQSLFLLLVVNPVSIAALDRVRDWFYDREPGEPFVVDWLKNITGYVFFLRDAVNYMVNKLEGKNYGFGTPVSMFGDLIGDVLTQVSTLTTTDDKAKQSKAWSRVIDKTIQLALLMQGLPYQTPKLLITGINKKERKSP